MDRLRALMLPALVVISIVVCTISLSYLITAKRAEHLREDKQACIDQGGKVIHLDRRYWCLVDGEKISF